MKWRTLTFGGVALAALFSMLACGGTSGLSRSKAEKIIQASAKFTPGQYMARPELQDGLNKGLWRVGPFNYLAGVNDVVATEKGKTYFSSVGGNAYRAGGGWQGWVSVQVSIPRHMVELTGIADGPGMLGPPGTVKDVQFTWKWDWNDIPNEVKSFVPLQNSSQPAAPLSKGEALLKLYDDGWRLEELQLH